MKQLQREKMLAVLREKEWVCVEEFSKLYIVDYRRRLVDLQDKGYLLESRRCTQHDYHGGGSKEWKLVRAPMKVMYEYELVDGVRIPRPKIVPI